MDRHSDGQMDRLREGWKDRPTDKQTDGLKLQTLHLEILKINSPLPATNENMAGRSSNMYTGRSPGQAFISKW